MNAALRRLLLRPRQLWLWRINFQIHLWAGVVLAIYITVIGATGSILVFGQELHSLLDPNEFPSISERGPLAHPAAVIDNIRLAFPHTHLVSLTGPTRTTPVFVAVLQRNVRYTVMCHPGNGRILGQLRPQPSRLDWVYNLHEDLLAGRPGRIANGIGAASLLLLVLTGIVNWWPGIRHWKRAIRVDFRKRWRRINFDLHSAIGFWSIWFLVLWAASGIYFVWPRDVLSIVNRLSLVVNVQPPAVTVNPDPNPVKLDFRALIATAYKIDPETTWKGIRFPYNLRSPLEILMSRRGDVGRDAEDTLYFNPYTGQYLSIWRYGLNKSLGDWIIWLQVPLHFGTHWGLVAKLVWALFGLALPALAITGLLMYWNRVLSKLV